MKTRILAGLALGALGLAAFTDAGIAREYRNASTAQAAVQRTGSIPAPRAFTSGAGTVVATERASGGYENTLHLFGARTDNTPY